jgi:thiol-disulfide isomerase/thioredoxin
MAQRARSVKDYQTQITSESQFNSLVTEEDTRLFVVDLYTTWCGPCTLMLPNCKNMAMKIDEWETRIAFVAVDTEFAPDLAHHS